MRYIATNSPLGDIAMKTGFAAGRFYIVVLAVVLGGVGAEELEGDAAAVR